MKKSTLLIITGCAGAGKTTIGKILARKLNWVFIDKDVISNNFTDYILKNSGERESGVYCNEIRPLEYKTTFEVCVDNLELGNNVILVIPFIAQITDFGLWRKMICEYNLNLENVDVKFVWIKHNPEKEFSNIVKRNAARDLNKIENWKTYCKEVKDLYPDSNYNALIFENNFESVDRINVDTIIDEIKR